MMGLFSRRTSVARRRLIWQPEHVVNASGAAFAARTYLEQTDVRQMLSHVAGEVKVAAACEVGAGFGRMTVVLTEFAHHVVGLEREHHLVAEARRLWPAIGFAQVETLASLPIGTATCDLVLSFTVLQHLRETVVADAVKEITRILKPGGHVLACEETDPTVGGDADESREIFTQGRPVSGYAQLFPDLELLDTRPRRVERTYPSADVGTYMLFRKRQ
jgi:SAM-dependent methyltransferase